MKKTAKYLLSIIILLVVILGLYLIYINFINKNKNPNVRELEEKYGEKYNYIQIENNTIQKEEFENIIKKVPKSNIYRDIYAFKKSTVSDLKPLIIQKALSKVDYIKISKDSIDATLKKIIDSNKNCYTTFYKTEKVNDYLKNEYNTTLEELDIKNIELSIGKFVKYNDDISYFAKEKNKESTTKNIYYINYLYIIRPENNDLTVLENKVFILLKDNKYLIYKNKKDILDDSKPIKEYNREEYNDFKDFSSKHELELADYATSFKHTFKKNDNGYYWYSSEIVE